MRPRRLGLWLGAACVLGLLGWGFRSMQGGCDYELLSSHPSPDGAWRADVVRSRCDVGMGGDALTMGVELSRPDGDAAPTDVLGVDAGSADHRPRVEWAASDRLRITVANISFVNVLTRRVGPVGVDVVFDPPDPAARAAWLRAAGLPADDASR